MGTNPPAPLQCPATVLGEEVPNSLLLSLCPSSQPPQPFAMASSAKNIRSEGTWCGWGGGGGEQPPTSAVGVGEGERAMRQCACNGYGNRHCDTHLSAGSPTNLGQAC
eukprot:GGOE01049117.1.p5 GENE.GGOE01049117.1~~GGOE01049117.1.p5  ORF type:complete len:108 (+),score=5.96 GGOE01049117.1:256-579(+)